jgi:hypothetical protein
VLNGTTVFVVFEPSFMMIFINSENDTPFHSVTDCVVFGAIVVFSVSSRPSTFTVLVISRGLVEVFVMVFDTTTVSPGIVDIPWSAATSKDINP